MKNAKIIGTREEKLLKIPNQTTPKMTSRDDGDTRLSVGSLSFKTVYPIQD